MGKIACINCKHWLRYDESRSVKGEKPLGECHRYALRPKWYDPNEDSEIIRVDWPLTYPSEWCGEFKSKGTT